MDFFWKTNYLMRKSWWKNILLSVIVFLAVVAAGYFGWTKSESWRMRQVSQLITDGERKIENGQAQAMWNLEEAYLLGLDYKVYNQDKAWWWYRLGDVRADGLAEDLYKKDWVDGHVAYIYGKKLFRQGEYDQVVSVWRMVGNDVGSEIKFDIDLGMTQMAGSFGKWEEAKKYLDDSLLLNTTDQMLKTRQQNMKLALALILGSEIYKDDVSLVSKSQDLKGYKGEAYNLQVAKKLIEMDLAQWAESWLGEMMVGGMDRRDIAVLMSYAYLNDDNCEMARRWWQEAYNLDSVDEKVLQLKGEVERCG